MKYHKVVEAGDIAEFERRMDDAVVMIEEKGDRVLATVFKADGQIPYRLYTALLVATDDPHPHKKV